MKRTYRVIKVQYDREGNKHQRKNKKKVNELQKKKKNTSACI